MLGKTHRATGLALFTAILAQEVTHDTVAVKTNPILNGLYQIVAKPIANFLDLHYATPADAYKFLLLAVIYSYVLKWALDLPDIDSKESYLGRYVPFIEDTIGHRTIFHTIFPVLLLSGVVFVTAGFYQRIAILVTAGYLFHLIEDAYSLIGINWFLIPTHHRFKPFRYSVDGPFEKITYYASLILIGVFILVMAVTLSPSILR